MTGKNKETEVKAGFCQACGKEIPDYPETAGGKGFVSPLSKENEERQVCKECYGKEFKEKYPRTKSPF
jgi:hypothetical protein